MFMCFLAIFKMLLSQDTERSRSVMACCASLFPVKLFSWEVAL